MHAYYATERETSGDRSNRHGKTSQAELDKSRYSNVAAGDLPPGDGSADKDVRFGGVRRNCGVPLRRGHFCCLWHAMRMVGRRARQCMPCMDRGETRRSSKGCPRGLCRRRRDRKCSKRDRRAPTLLLGVMPCGGGFWLNRLWTLKNNSIPNATRRWTYGWTSERAPFSGRDTSIRPCSARSGRNVKRFAASPESSGRRSRR